MKLDLNALPGQLLAFVKKPPVIVGLLFVVGGLSWVVIESKIRQEDHSELGSTRKEGETEKTRAERVAATIEQSQEMRRRAEAQVKENSASQLKEAKSILQQVLPEVMENSSAERAVAAYLAESWTPDENVTPRNEDGSEQKKDERPQGQEIDQAIAHLEAALLLSPQMEEARALLLHLYLRRHEAHKATPHLLKVVEQVPPARLVVSVLFENDGLTLEAKGHAGEAARYFESAVERDEKVLSRLQWALAVSLLGESERSLAIISEGRAKNQDRRYDELEVMVRMRQCHHWLMSPSPPFQEVIASLAEVLRLSPRNQVAHDRLSELSNLEPTRKDVEQLLIDMSGAGAHYEVFLILGNLAAQRRDFSAAVELMDRAMALNPDSAIVKNNLAWCLSEMEPPQLERALALVTEAGDHWQARYQRVKPEFQETRGQILIKMERWQEAVNPLESALPFVDPATKLKVHASLARAYGQLGNVALRDLHDRLAKEEAPVAEGLGPLK